MINRWSKRCWCLQLRQLAASVLWLGLQIQRWWWLHVGQLPGAQEVAGGSILVQRRSLGVRVAENLSEAAVTPQTFLDRVQGARGSQDPHYVPSHPVSYGPAPVIEEVMDC